MHQEKIDSASVKYNFYLHGLIFAVYQKISTINEIENNFSYNKINLRLKTLDGLKVELLRVYHW